MGPFMQMVLPKCCAAILSRYDDEYAACAMMFICIYLYVVEEERFRQEELPFFAHEVAIYAAKVEYMPFT